MRGTQKSNIGEYVVGLSRVIRLGSGKYIRHSNLSGGWAVYVRYSRMENGVVVGRESAPERLRSTYKSTK